jgi:hypothetical protein
MFLPGSVCEKGPLCLRTTRRASLVRPTQYDYDATGWRRPRSSVPTPGPTVGTRPGRGWCRVSGAASAIPCRIVAKRRMPKEE